MRKVHTNSAHDPSKYSALEEFFKSTDDEAETFVDTLKDVIQQKSGVAHKDDIRRKLIFGKPDQVTAPKRFAEQLSGFVRIFHGWHRDDYAWHIEHAAIRKPWKVTDARVIYIIAVVMNKHLPDIEAKIWPPQPDWELRTITFKAMGLATDWSFEESSIEKINRELFEVLNAVV